MFDVIVIGAGITGTLIARELSCYDLKVAVVERCSDIADGATMANSAIVHTGYDPEDGTLKAELNVKGARMYKQLCEDLGCLYKVVGSYVAACGKEEEQHLAVLKDRAIRRGITVEEMDGDEARSREKNLNEDVTGVLYFPETAVIYPWDVAIAAMENAMENGVELHLDTTVLDIENKDSGYVVKTDRCTFETKMVISCAGTHAREIASMVSELVPYDITPRKGEYYVLDQNTDFVHSIVFPVPGVKGKGILAVPTVYGNVLIGPNSAYCNDIDDVDHTTMGLSEVKQGIGKTMKNVPFHKVIRNFAGLRPSSTMHDFVIQEYEDAKHFIDVACIESPGLASAPAIAAYVMEHFVLKELSCRKKESFTLVRKRPLVMSELSLEERNAAIERNPLYGKIICRCETISEGEIVDCIHSTCGARSIKGVKKRVRPGMGRCQGGFCEPLVAKILARELGIPLEEVTLDGKTSEILKGENR